jgi:hypothetical protein
VLKNNVRELDFADNPTFADLVLGPLLQLGNNVRVVSGFAPSYVVRTLERMVSLPSAPSGKMTFVLCLPALPYDEIGLRAVAQHLVGQSSDDWQPLFKLARNAVDQGIPFEIQMLVPSKGAVITRSAVGLIEDTEAITNRVGFIDELAGDNNSAIHLSRSWIAEEEDVTDRFEDLVHAAINDSWSSVSRLVDIDFDELLTYMGEAPQETVLPTHAVPVPTAIATFEVDGDDDDDSVDDLDAEFEELVELVELADGEIDDVFTAFYSDPSQTAKLWDLASARSRGGWVRPHAAAVSLEILELAGDVTNQCWCGNEYSISQGCPDQFE